MENMNTEQDLVNWMNTATGQAVRAIQSLKDAHDEGHILARQLLTAGVRQLGEAWDTGTPEQVADAVEVFLDHVSKAKKILSIVQFETHTA